MIKYDKPIFLQASNTLSKYQTTDCANHKHFDTHINKMIVHLNRGNAYCLTGIAGISLVH